MQEIVFVKIFYEVKAKLVANLIVWDSHLVQFTKLKVLPAPTYSCIGLNVR